MVQGAHQKAPRVYWRIWTPCPSHSCRGGVALLSRLPAVARLRHAPAMFAVSEEDAAAIRAAFDQAGELSAAIELRRRFPGITDNATARANARIIASWKSLPAVPRPLKRPRPVATRDDERPDAQSRAANASEPSGGEDNGMAPTSPMTAGR